MQQVPTRSSVTQACRRLAVGAVAALAVLGSLAATTAVDAATMPNGAVANVPGPQPKPVITPKLGKIPIEVPTMSVKVGTTVLLSAAASTHTGEWNAFWTTSDGGPAVRSEVLAHKFDTVGLIRVNLTVQDYYGEATTFGYVNVTRDSVPNTPGLTLTPSTDQTVTVGQSVSFSTNTTVTTLAFPGAAASVTQTWWSSDGVGQQGGEDFTRTFNRAGVFYVTAQKASSDGAIAAQTVKVTVRNRDGGYSPEIKLAPSPQVVNRGDSVGFDATKTTDREGGQLSYQWSIADPTTPTTASLSASAAPPSPATYSAIFNDVGWQVVTLRVTDPQGHTSIENAYVLVKETSDHVPVAELNPSGEITVALGAHVVFDATASSDADGPLAAVEWFSDDGLIGWPDLTYPVDFSSLGARRVIMRVTDRDGNVAEKQAVVNVVKSGAPISKFDGPLSVKAGETVTYDASPSSDPVGRELRYSWYVNGNPDAVSTDKVLNYAFPKAGSYTLELRVTDPRGGFSSRIEDITVSATNRAPVAKLSGPATVTAKQPVTFDGSASTDPDGDALTYAWRVRGKKGVVGSDKVLNYTFPTGGKSAVELTVTDPSGASSKQWLAVTVTSTNRAPVARFTVPSNIQPNAPVSFDGSASSDPDNDALTYAWRVRGAKGVVSTEKVLNFEFKKAGKYGVELTVTDPSGASAKQWVEVKVNQPPVANFSAPSSVQANTKVRFDGSSSSDPDGDALTYAWYVRGFNGVASTNKVLDYTFPKAGSYGVQLVVTDSSGATAKKWVGVAVK